MSLGSQIANPGQGGARFAMNNYVDAAVTYSVPYTQIAFGVDGSLPTVVTSAAPLPVTLGVSTVTVTQATGSNLHVAVDSLPSLPAGSALIGGVKLIDTGGTNAAAVSAGGALSVAVVSGANSNPAASATGSAVPSSADYAGLNVAGNLRGQTGVNVSGVVYAAQTDLTSVGGASLAIGQHTMGASLPVTLASDQSALSVNAAQSGTWNIGTVATVTNTVTVAGSGTFTTQDLADGSVAPGTVATKSTLAGGKYTSAGVALTDGQQAALQVDSSGHLLVNAVVVSGANAAAGLTGSAVPSSGSYNAVNIGGTLRGQTGVNVSGVVYAAQSDITSFGGAAISLGQAIMASSVPVVLASNQAAIPVSQSGSWSVTANAGTNLNTSALALDTSVNGILLSQASTTNGQKGPLVQGSVTTSAPSYTTAQTSPLSLTTGGALRVDASAATLTDAADGPVTPGAVASKSALAGGQYNSTPPTLTNTQQAAVQLDSSGNLKVNIVAGSAANAAAGLTGSAPPASADYAGINVGGTLRGQTGVNPTGSIFAAQVDITSIGGTSLVFGQAAMAASLPVVIASNQSAFPVSQSGTWNVGTVTTVTSITNPVTVTGSGTFTTSDLADGSVTGGTAGTKSVLGGAIHNTSSPTLTNGQQAGLQSDASGNLLVNVAAGTTGNPAASATGSTVPANADYQGLNVAGVLRGQTGSNPTGSVYAAQTDIVSISGTPLGFGQSMMAGSLPVAIASDQTGIPAPPDTTTTGTISNSPGTGAVQIATSGQATVAVQITGTWTGMIDFQRSVDGTTWETCTAVSGTSVVSATTANGEFYVNAAGNSLVRAIGANVATGSATIKLRASAAPVSLSILNSVTTTAASDGATGSAVPSDAAYIGGNVGGNLRGLTAANPTGSVYALQTDVASVGGTSFALGQQLAAASLPVVLTASQLTTLTPLSTVAVTQSTSPWVGNTTQLGGTAIDTNSGNKSAGTQRFVLATDQPNLTSALNVSAVITAGSAVIGHVIVDSGTVTANVGTTGGITVAQGSTTSGESGPLVQGAVTTAAPSYTTAQTSPLSLTTTGALRTDGSGATQPVSGTVAVSNAFALDTSVNGLLVAQASTTSGQTGPLVQTATTTSAPTYTTAKTNPLSTTTAGALRSDINSLAGTTVDTNSGNKSAGTQRIVLATDQPNLTTPLNVQGGAANGASASGNPVQSGGTATNVEATAVTTGQAVSAAYTLTGKQIVSPYTNPENTIMGSVTSTDASTHNIFASQGAGVRSYITSIQLYNSSATAVLVTLTDGTSTIYLPAPATSGCVFSLPTPFRSAAATAVTIQSSSGVSTISVSAQGYKGT